MVEPSATLCLGAQSLGDDHHGDDQGDFVYDCGDYADDHGDSVND